MLNKLIDSGQIPVARCLGEVNQPEREQMNQYEKSLIRMGLDWINDVEAELGVARSSNDVIKVRNAIVEVTSRLNRIREDATAKLVIIERARYNARRAERDAHQG